MDISMRRKIGITLSMLLGFSLLCGCGNKLDVEESTVYVQKNGSVISTDIEDFSADYYDEDELKDYIDDEISSYNSENGKKSVSLKDVSVKDSQAKLTMKYKTADDYTKFNGVELYSGTIVKAQADGYDFGVDFVSVKDGEVTGTATKDEIVEHDDYKVAIIQANTDVKVDGTIVYVSSQNVNVIGKNTVSIREGYQAAQEETTNEVGSTESIAETEQKEADQTEDLSEDEFASESDVYTYVIFK